MKIDNDIVEPQMAIGGDKRESGQANDRTPFSSGPKALAVRILATNAIKKIRTLVNRLLFILPLKPMIDCCLFKGLSA